MAKSDAQQERVFTLLLALMETRDGLTRAQIFSRIAGYGDPENASHQRMFERDKRELRAAGYQIETLEAFDDNKFTRYRLDPTSILSLDAMTFDSGERVLLALALQLWEESALGDDARRAKMRLRADPEFTGSLADPIATGTRAMDPALAPLRTACEEGLVAHFDYHRPGAAQPRTRRVEAWAVVFFAGRWLFHGFDLDLQQPRTFLLRRFVSKVTTSVSKRRIAPPEDIAQRALAELEDLWNHQRATVSAVPGSDADMRLRRRNGTTADGERLHIHYSDEALLADELTGYATDVEVHEPASLAAAVRERLRRIANDHPIAIDMGNSDFRPDTSLGEGTNG
ncbi:MAG TPA: WYL domain-containing protein [Candidatus Agrococcus pullicola]|uniref:WYL domain-containing protein n=1 Tax=Candidatus Agrococcus pullicola TaxID=2838429 RepID=A0A9D2CB71_9MICO|nr:WYL domain-containing protein [Candidatus Agrococcus pullicola]